MSARQNRGQPATTPTPDATNGMNLSELKEKSIGDLNTIAETWASRTSAASGSRSSSSKSSNPNRRRMV